MVKIAVGRAVVLVAIFLGLTFSFVTNGLGVAPWVDWSIWERGSTAMVLQRIEADLLQRDTSPLGLADYGVGDESAFDRLTPEGLETLEATAPEDFIPYESEIGGQAYFWSFLWREMGCSSISCQHLIGSAITAAMIVALFLGLSLIGSAGLGWAWLLAVGTSPWITFAARNLFWSPGLYFLPAIAAVGLVLARTRLWRSLAAIGVFTAFLIKYVATGYHEFTAFTMLAASIPVIAILFGRTQGLPVMRQWKNSLLILASSAVALAGTLIAHAYILAGDVGQGLERIWVNVILRRTYGDSANYDPQFVASLEASPFEVVWKYLWSSWSTDMLSMAFDKSGSLFSVSLGRFSFALLIVITLGIVLWRWRRRDARWRRDASLLALGFVIPVFWFVAAKGYSYVHTHLLFFLWYFLYIPALLYVTGAFLWDERHRLGRLLMKSGAFLGFAPHTKSGSGSA